MTEPEATHHAAMSSEPITQEELDILNNDLLPALAQAHDCIDLLNEKKKHGRSPGWDIITTPNPQGGQQAVMVPCMKDADENTVVLDVQTRQPKTASNMMKTMLPFVKLQWLSLRPESIAVSNQRLNDPSADEINAVLKPEARQEIGMVAAQVENGKADTSDFDLVHSMLLEMTTDKASQTLIKSKHPTFAEFKGDWKVLRDNILDKDWAKVYAWIKPSRTKTDASGNEYDYKEISCRSNMFPNVKSSPANMNPENSAPVEFEAYSARDKALITSVLEGAKGTRKFSPIPIIREDGSRGSSAELRPGCIVAPIVGIGNFNKDKSRGGAVFVRKICGIIVYRNGPERREEKAFDAKDFMANMLKRKRGEESEPIKGTPARSKKHQSKTLSRLEDAKKKLADRKRAAQKARENDTESE